MSDQDELAATLGRLEAALAAAARSVSAIEPPPDLSGDLAAAQARAETAEARIAALEAELAEARAEASPPPQEEPDRLRTALVTLSGTLDGLRKGAEGAADASLAAEVEALRAARALDLAEIEALLREMEPMLERADA